MQKYQFISLDSVLSKYYRDFRGLGIEEADAIEWIGEALGFINLIEASEEAIAFLEVKNYQAQIPPGLKYIIQVARNNNWVQEECCTEREIVQQLTDTPSGCDWCNKDWTDTLVPVDCDGQIMGDYEVAYYRPFWDHKFNYGDWGRSGYNNTNYSPVRLADHTFFNSLVCTVPEAEGLYSASRDEYTIVQDYLRFSFKEGFVAVAYVRQMLDPKTGYPMVPDDISAATAITYYMAWKVKQWEWIVTSRENAERQAASMEQRWLKYKKQFDNKTKMSTIDQMQDSMDQNSYLIPRTQRYYGFFGNLSQPEARPYNNPNANRYGRW